MTEFTGRTEHPDITIEDLSSAADRSEAEYRALVDRIKEYRRRKERFWNVTSWLAAAVLVVIAWSLLFAGCAAYTARNGIHAVQPTPASWEVPGPLKARGCVAAETVTFPKNVDDPAVAGRTVVVLECFDGQRMLDRTTKEERVFLQNGATR